MEIIITTDLTTTTAERLELMRSLKDEGKTLQEIADMLGYKSRSTVMNMLKRAE